MKKFLLVAALFVAVISNKTMANNAGLFAYDDDQVSVQLTQATEIENYVTTHENATLSNLQADANVSDQLDLGNFNASAASFTFDDINWKAWAWGFCCWPIGIFTVILKDSSTREDKISFVIGILTGFVLAIPGYLSAGI
jgi:hypothetical protein